MHICKRNKTVFFFFMCDSRFGFRSQRECIGERCNTSANAVDMSVAKLKNLNLNVRWPIVQYKTLKSPFAGRPTILLQGTG